MSPTRESRSSTDRSVTDGVRVRRTVRVVGGLLAASMGALALLGWIRGPLVLATFGEGWIPMAPSTALLFLVLGNEVAFRERILDVRWLSRVAVATTTLAVLLALALLVLSTRGIAPDLEHLGLRITGTLGGAPLGHMSPLTALAFVLAGASLLIGFVSRPEDRGGRPALVLAFGTVIIGGALAVAYTLGGPLLYGSEIIPPAFTTSLAFVGLGAALGASSWAPGESVSGVPDGEVRRDRLLITVAFVLGAAAIMVSGWFSFQHYAEDFRGEVERQLTAVADLTVEEIVGWRRERLSDAVVFSGNEPFTDLVRRYSRNPDDDAARRALLSWLGNVLAAYDYGHVILTDGEGRLLLKVPADGAPVPLHLAEDAIRVMESGRVSLVDFHRDPADSGVYLTALAPVVDTTDAGNPVGALALRIDASTHVYPLIDRWPTTSGSAETLLVRRDGNDVLFLNDTRFRPDAALRIRIPLSRTEVPAVMAVRGREGIVEGVDYRGERVLAALRDVPDTPWHLVARMDAAEILAPLRDRLWWMVGIVGLLIFGAAGAAGLAWQSRKAAFYRSVATAEAARRESERRYRKLFEEAPVGIFRTTSSGVPLRVNSTLAEMLDFDSVEAALDGYDDLTEDLYVDAERRVDFLRLLEERGSVEQFQHRVRTAEGRTIWVEISARIAERGEDGTYVIDGFVTDITRRKKAQESLLKSRELLNASQELAGVGGWEWNVEAEEMYWTEEVYRIHELDATDFSDKGSDDLVEASLGCYHEEEREKVLQAFQRCIEEGEPYDLELPFTTAKGNDRWVRTIGRPVFRGAEVVRVVGNIMDVTERKEADQARARLRDELAQAQRVEAVGRLAGGVAHDFNNMLAVILGNIEMALAEVEAGSAVREDLIEVRDAARRSADLTRQLLAFARRQTVAPEILDLNEAVEDILKMLRRLIGENIELAWHPCPDPWPVEMDPAQIDQILTNLMVNARDAISGIGHVTIETGNVELDELAVENHPHLTPGRYVRLTVTDDGEGMPSEVRGQIFEPFFTTKAEGEGTGLGLAMVYGIVKQNNGYIHVYSEPGRGTSFKIYLPAFPGEAESPDEVERDLSGHRGDETVLVVEDEAALLRLVVRTLDELGYDVIRAGGPREALEIVEAGDRTIDLLLTDVVMPGMNGRDLADRIVEARPGIRILFMSGYTDRVMGREGVLEKGVDFVQKPFSTRALARRVREVLDR